MPTILCQNAIEGCECIESSPYRNISAEAPDLPAFLSLGFARVVPPLGTQWDAIGCFTTCESTVSQQAADLCAAEQAFLCATGSWQSPGFPGGVSDPPVPPPRGPHGRVPVQRFFNSPQVGMANCPDGLPFLLTVPSATFAGLSQAAADAAALSYANRQAQLRMICLSMTPSNPVCVGTATTFTITATGAFLAAPGQFDQWVFEAGTLPPGMTFNGGAIQGGVATITGTPTTPGSYFFIIGVTDPLGDFMAKAFTINVGGLTNAAIPQGQTGNAYSFQVLAADGRASLFSATGLPPGLSMDILGNITGTPTTPGAYNPIVTIVDVATGVTCQQKITMTIKAAGLWDALVWGVPTNASSGGGSATVNSIGQNQFDFSVSTDGVFGSTGALQNASFPNPGPDGGQMTYYGIPVDSNLHLEATGTNTGLGNFTGRVFVFIDGVVVLDTFPVGLTPGGQDFPFTLPNSSPGLVQVAYVFDINAAAGAGMGRVVATFTPG